MNVETVRRVEDIEPISLATDATEIALATYDKLLDLLEHLEPSEWTAQTDCPDWTVSDMVGHLIGAGRANASLRELIRQQLWATRHKREFGGNDLDAMNALQVRDTARLGDAEKVATLRALAPRAVRGRMRLPAPLRSIRIPLAQNGSTADGMPTSLALGHLMQVVYTRDLWLHGIDIARATGRELVLDQVDARVVEDVVLEWVTRHGHDVELHLTGPAGGRFRHGDGGDTIELDAVEFCRILSGRAAGTGLLATRVAF